MRSARDTLIASFFDVVTRTTSKTDKKEHTRHTVNEKLSWKKELKIF